jgi:hypothetical protein
MFLSQGIVGSLHHFPLFPSIGAIGPPPKNTYRSDILRMLENDTFADVFFHFPFDPPSNESGVSAKKAIEYLGCHKCILSVRCPVMGSLIPMRKSSFPIPSWRRRFVGEDLWCDECGDDTSDAIAHVEISSLLTSFQPLPSSLSLFCPLPSSSSPSLVSLPSLLKGRNALHIVTDVRRALLVALVCTLLLFPRYPSFFLQGALSLHRGGSLCIA